MKILSIARINQEKEEIKTIRGSGGGGAFMTPAPPP